VEEGQFGYKPHKYNKHPILQGCLSMVRRIQYFHVRSPTYLMQFFIYLFKCAVLVEEWLFTPLTNRKLMCIFCPFLLFPASTSPLPLLQFFEILEQNQWQEVPAQGTPCNQPAEVTRSCPLLTTLSIKILFSTRCPRNLGATTLFTLVQYLDMEGERER
jgi:hypothetical protein